MPTAESIKRTRAYKKIKTSLVDQLERSGNDTPFFLDLVDDYMKMYIVKELANADILENGVSVLDCLIHFALTGRMADYPIIEKDNARFSNLYCHLYILGKEERIAKFDGLDYLKQKPEVSHISQMKRVGDKIGADGTSAQKVVGLHLKVVDVSSLKKVLIEIENNFHFYDDKGHDLTINFNSNIL